MHINLNNCNNMLQACLSIYKQIGSQKQSSLSLSLSLSLYIYIYIYIYTFALKKYYLVGKIRIPILIRAATMRIKTENFGLDYLLYSQLPVFHTAAN